MQNSLFKPVKTIADLKKARDKLVNLKKDFQNQQLEKVSSDFRVEESYKKLLQKPLSSALSLTEGNIKTKTDKIERSVQKFRQLMVNSNVVKNTFKMFMSEVEDYADSSALSLNDSALELLNISNYVSGKFTFTLDEGFTVLIILKQILEVTIDEASIFIVDFDIPPTDDIDKELYDLILIIQKKNDSEVVTYIKEIYDKIDDLGSFLLFLKEYSNKTKQNPEEILRLIYLNLQDPNFIDVIKEITEADPAQFGKLLADSVKSNKIRDNFEGVVTNYLEKIPGFNQLAIQGLKDEMAKEKQALIALGQTPTQPTPQPQPKPSTVQAMKDKNKTYIDDSRIDKGYLNYLVNNDDKNASHMNSQGKFMDKYFDLEEFLDNRVLISVPRPKKVSSIDLKGYSAEIFGLFGRFTVINEMSIINKILNDVSISELKELNKVMELLDFDINNPNIVQFAKFKLLFDKISSKGGVKTLPSQKEIDDLEKKNTNFVNNEPMAKDIKYIIERVNNKGANFLEKNGRFMDGLIDIENTLKTGKIDNVLNINSGPADMPYIGMLFIADKGVGKNIKYLMRYFSDKDVEDVRDVLINVFGAPPGDIGNKNQWNRIKFKILANEYSHLKQNGKRLHVPDPDEPVPSPILRRKPPGGQQIINPTGKGIGMRLSTGKVGSGGQFGSLYIDPKALNTLRLKVYRGKNARAPKVVDSPIDNEMYDLLTKRFSPKKKYGGSNLKLFQDLLKLSELPVTKMHSKKKDLISGKGMKFYQNHNELFDRIKLLLGSWNAGNKSAEIFNEVHEIGDVLRKKGKISKDDYKLMMAHLE